MSVKIRNTNDVFGDAIEFVGETIDDAVRQMQVAVRACGGELEYAVVNEEDYEVIEPKREPLRINADDLQEAIIEPKEIAEVYYDE